MSKPRIAAPAPASVPAVPPPAAAAPAPASVPGFKSALNALGARLTGTGSRSREREGPNRGTVGVSPTSEWTAAVVDLPGVGVGVGRKDVQSESHSPVRGRELYSTGRGGAGNIHRSQSRDAAVVAPVSSEPPHGREPSLSQERISHLGRGGAGNFRDPSKHREIAVDPKDVIHEHAVIEHFDESPHRYSIGRGGAGNIKVSPENSQSRDHSVEARSLSRGRALHSTGRGGAGNITSEPVQEEIADELERRAHSPSRVDQVHSTGRGGLANVTSVTSPPVEHIHEGHEEGEGGFFTTGRGGVGNIRDRSGSRGGGPRGGGEQHHQGPIGKIVDRVKKHHDEPRND